MKHVTNEHCTFNRINRMIELTMNCTHNFRIEKDWRLNDQHKNKPRLAFRIWFKVYKVQPMVDASGFTLGFASVFNVSCARFCKFSYNTCNFLPPPSLTLTFFSSIAHSLMLHIFFSHMFLSFVGCCTFCCWYCCCCCSCSYYFFFSRW